MNEMANSGVDRVEVPPMSERSRLGLGIVVLSLVLGLLGDGLLRASPWGINVFLWLGSLVLGVIGLLEWRGIKASGEGRWLVVPALFFAASVAWRASPVLIFLNILALLVTLALAAWRTRKGQIRLAGMAEYLLSLFVAGLNGVFGPFILAFKIEWGTIPRTGWSGQLLAVGRGVLITMPLLFVFGGLLMAADAIFENLVIDLFDIDIDELFGHFFWFGFWAWLSAGFLRQMLLDDSEPIQQVEKIQRPSFAKLGIIEVGILLGALNLLFVSFVLVQFRYFFGGAALVEVTSDLSYAEYARQGFFELVMVAALLLPLLLLVHWLLRTENPRHETLFRVLAGALIALLYVIMVSALQRMRLYQNEFGLTELRLYTTAFMGWLAILFAWFIATVLRGQRERFVFGALISAFATLALLQLLNPDALIVRTNVGRHIASQSASEDTSDTIRRTRQPFDSYYVTTLSADSVPTLINSLSQIKESERCQVAARILDDWSPPEEGIDWRTWNWARYRASQTVQQHLGTLQTMACLDR
ncbi:MAG: DUF4153 domain-containing protein [Ardenticatenaceae bacterium]